MIYDAVLEDFVGTNGVVLRIDDISLPCVLYKVDVEIFRSYKLGSTIPVDLWCEFDDYDGAVHGEKGEKKYGRQFKIFQGKDRWDYCIISGEVVEIWETEEETESQYIRLSSKLLIDVSGMHVWDGGTRYLKTGDWVYSEMSYLKVYPLRVPPYPIKYIPEYPYLYPFSYYEGAKHLGDMDELMAKYGDIIKHNMEIAKHTDWEGM